MDPEMQNDSQEFVLMWGLRMELRKVVEKFLTKWVQMTTMAILQVYILDQNSFKCNSNCKTKQRKIFKLDNKHDY